jgi:diguanylate cyclase (GGDEF)-like protein
MHKVELLKRIAENPNIPSPPTVVLRVLERASAPDCTIGELCQLLQVDPGLSGKILRVVNSAMFGLSRPVTSVQRALAVVGINSARLLLLSISLPAMVQTKQLEAILMQRYWQSSLAGAVVAQALAQRLQARDSEDDMAAALLRDLGELVLRQMFPQALAEIDNQPAGDFVLSQCRFEDEACGLNHAEVSAFILDRWRLPKEMSEPVKHHHHPDDAEFSTPKAQHRAYTLHFATRAAQLLAHPDQPVLLQHLLELGSKHFNMNGEEVTEFLAPLSDKISDFAALLKVDMGPTNDFATVLGMASTELVKLSLTANLDRQHEAEMKRRAEIEAQRWRQEAAFDPLTKVFNRRFLELKLQELIQQTADNGSRFGVLFIDLDGFKPLNDRFGHGFGDLVLQQVAECLTREVRQEDIVARYGGDEFCVVATQVDEHSLRMLGQRIWERINDMTVRQGSSEGKVGASIGTVLHDRNSTWNGPAELLAAADAAMYQAKTQGKNRIVTLSSPPVSAAFGGAVAATRR